MPQTTQAIAPAFKLGLSFRSEVRAISRAVDRLMQLLRRAHCIPGDEHDVELALREALANAVIHGNHNDASKRVYIRACAQPGDGVVLAVRDEGAGFDEAQLPDPLADENILSDHGRGIFLMKQFMDDVQFIEGGAEVRMRKGLNGAGLNSAAQRHPLRAAA